MSDIAFSARSPEMEPRHELSTGSTKSSLQERVDRAATESLKAAGNAEASTTLSGKVTSKTSQDDTESVAKIRDVQILRLQAAMPRLSVDVIQQVYKQVDANRQEKLEAAALKQEDITEKIGKLSVVYTEEGHVHLHVAGRIIDLDTGKLVGSLFKDAAPNLTPTKIRQIYEHVDVNRSARLLDAQKNRSDVTEGDSHLSITYRVDGSVNVVTDGRSIDFDTGEIVASHLQRMAPQLSTEDIRAIYREIDENGEAQLLAAAQNKKRINVVINDKVQLAYDKNGSILLQVAGRVLDFNTGEIIRSNLQKKVPGLKLETIKEVYKHVDANKASYLARARQSGQDIKVTIGDVVFSYNTNQSVTLLVAGRTIDIASGEVVQYKIEGASHISSDTAKKIYDYVDEHREVLLESAKLKGSDIYLRPRQTGLARTIQVTKEGRIFVLLNRKKLGDRHLGTGYAKVVTLAVELETGKLFASAGLKIADDNELENLKRFGNENGFVRLVSDVTYQNRAGNLQKQRLILELCDAGDLGGAFKGFGLILEEKKSIFDEVIGSVALMHQRGYLHRDLKPANIFLSRNKETNKLQTHVADFGFVCAQNDRIAKQKFCGTSLYMSPEYAKAAINSTAATGFQGIASTAHDVWALGCVLARIVDISLPWDNAKTNPEVLQRIANLSPNWLLEPANKNSPQHLVWEMLQVDPAHRISAAEAHKRVANLQWR
ncbi:MAG: protein kinase [Chlamydiales bacterium]|nr:protein kinase [Chlamydiales bacterium]